MIGKGAAGTVRIFASHQSGFLPERLDPGIIALVTLAYG